MLLSILIRNRNEAENLKVTLQSIRKQACDFTYEIILVDNESEDNSVEIALAAGAKVFSLKRSDFSFGHALNFGIEQCAGEFILILSAHVILLNEYFLQLIPGYFADQQVAGLRFSNASDTSMVRNSIKFGPQQLVYANDEKFIRQHWTHLLVNHCAAIRKSCWLHHQYDWLLFASEDKQWSLDILAKGYTLLYNIPCYYAYIKQVNRQGKIRRAAIEGAATKIITGYGIPAYDQPYVFSLLTRLTSSFKKVLTDIYCHRQEYLQVKRLLNRYKKQGDYK